jgi:hypothetical protein
MYKILVGLIAAMVVNTSSAQDALREAPMRTRLSTFSAALAALCFAALYTANAQAPAALADVGTATAAIEVDAANITYPQIYVSADGETHFREVTPPLTLLPGNPPATPFPQSALMSATGVRWAVLPKGWGVDDFKNGTFHSAALKRFISVRKGTISIQVSDGELREFQKGDILEVLDVEPSRGHISFTESGAELLFTNHP